MSATCKEDFYANICYLHGLNFKLKKDRRSFIGWLNCLDLLVWLSYCTTLICQDKQQFWIATLLWILGSHFWRSSWHDLFHVLIYTIRVDRHFHVQSSLHEKNLSTVIHILHYECTLIFKLKHCTAAHDIFRASSATEKAFKLAHTLCFSIDSPLHRALKTSICLEKCRGPTRLWHRPWSRWPHNRRI